MMESVELAFLKLHNLLFVNLRDSKGICDSIESNFWSCKGIFKYSGNICPENLQESLREFPENLRKIPKQSS